MHSFQYEIYTLDLFDIHRSIKYKSYHLLNNIFSLLSSTLGGALFFTVL